MASTTGGRKRKNTDRKAESPPVDDENLAIGELDGVLSDSEAEFEDELSDADLSIGLSEDLGTSDEEEDEEELDSDEFASSGDDEDDVRDQIRDLQAVKKQSTTQNGSKALVNGSEPELVETIDANGNPRFLYPEIDPVYDSDDSDVLQPVNTIGNIPLSYYDAYPHIGYDINGRKISRPAKGEALDALLDSIDIPEGWTGLTDPATGKPLALNADELEMLKRLTRNEAPGDGYDPYPDLVDWFTRHEEIMPLSAAPEPKRRFVPSKHEQKRVMKMVKAIKEGRIQPFKSQEEKDAEQERDVKAYDIWADEVPRPDHAMHMPAPKLPPPGYAESYHPPPEYLPDAGEKKAWEEADEEDREKDFLPTDHSALRKVPGYARFIKEKFERCLDLYLAPRVRRSKLNIDPESLLPKLPSPEELRPFPTVCATLYRGHQGRVRSVSIDPLGLFVASGGDDGTIRVWELLTGRQLWSARISREETVNAVRWRPSRDTMILSAAAGETVYFAVPFSICAPAMEEASRDILDVGFGYATQQAPSAQDTSNKPKHATWARPPAKLVEQGVLLSCTLRSVVKVISWHRRGDYLSTVSPTGASQAVSIHTLSKHLTQHPFRRLRGLAQTCSFHPSRPLFFVATRQSIRVYDLQAQKLEKDLKPGARWISAMDVHAGGDNVLVGSYDRRLLWHDLDLGATPYKTLRYHEKAIRAVKYHPSSGMYPLFADASDDGTIQVFHGKVVNDSLENATIVPLKVLKGHRVASELGVLDLDWHPSQPWLVSAGADGTIRLWN
ncbi:hypothetical protein ANO11243_057830 [Dothideomycetidae sp. 11243]|nr:hypothetical protein ANO11243_057830 [fungal sp. No.11243]